MFLSKQNNIRWRLVVFSAFVVLTLVLLGVYWYDKPLFMWLRGFDCKLLHMFSVLFDAWVWLLVFGILTVAIYIKKVIKANGKRITFSQWFNVRNFILNVKSTNVFAVFCAVLGTSVIGKLLKIIIGRFRPVFFEALGMTGFNPGSTEWAFNSMPSGHAFATFAGLVVIGMLKPKYKWATWTLAIIIGLSRVVVGAHWPSDVLLGAFMGMLGADITLSKLRK